MKKISSFLLSHRYVYYISTAIAFALIAWGIDALLDPPATISFLKTLIIFGFLFSFFMYEYMAKKNQTHRKP